MGMTVLKLSPDPLRCACDVGFGNRHILDIAALDFL